jgi:tyrosine-protein kinase Etk/Wzc
MTDIKRKVIKDDDEFDVKKFLSRFIDHWKLFAISLIFFLLLGFLFIRYSTPLYKAHAQVLIQEDQNNSAAASFMGSSQIQDFS